MSSMVARLESVNPSYKQLVTRFEPEQGIMWFSMDARPRPCFNPELLADLRKFQRTLELINRSARMQGRECPVRYPVCCSQTPGIFSLGGDIFRFSDWIREGKVEELRQYALACVEIVFASAVNYNLPVTTIALVQGDALGGGFEAALSCTVIVAEKGAHFGLPEVLFNLFPGMGAYSLLARRMDAARAEKMILSGRIYSAYELHEMGIVDVLAEDGEGERAVYDFVRQHSRRRNAYQSIYRVRNRFVPVKYEELRDVADIWVDAALNLTPKDLRLMERLLRAQDKALNGTKDDNGVGQVRA